MQDFPCSRVGELYRNPEYNIAYIGHLGVVFGNGLVINKFRKMPPKFKPDVLFNGEVIGKVNFTNYSIRNNHLYAYTSAFDFTDDQILTPTFLLKRVECISCGRIMRSTDKPCPCVLSTHTLIIHDYVLVGCELHDQMNYTNVGSTRENILENFFQNEFSFIEILEDANLADGDKWCPRLNLDIEM